MSLCDVATAPKTFMREPDLEKRSYILLHEGVHGATLAVPAGGTLKGPEDVAYPYLRVQPLLSTADAIKNPDSYGVLIYKLNNQPQPMGPAAPDVAVGGGPIPADVNAAVAWLEVWLKWSEIDVSNVYDWIKEGIARGTSVPGDLMMVVATGFGLTKPPALPVNTDEFAVAAILDRIETMSRAIRSPISIESKAGVSTSWGAGPVKSVVVGDDFNAVPVGAHRTEAQADLLLRSIIAATAGISSAVAGAYVAIVHKVRSLRHGGP